MNKKNPSIIFFIILIGIIWFLFLREEAVELKDEAQEADINSFIDQENINIDHDEKVRPIDSTDNVWGREGAEVDIIVYSDFTCIFCFDFYQTINQVKKEFKDNVRIAFRHFPIKKRQENMIAGLASVCASKQGKFWEMHDRLFEEANKNSIDKGKIIAQSEFLDLDVKEFNECLDKKDYSIIEKDIEEAKFLGIVGSPSIFINKIFYPGAYPMDDFVDDREENKKGLRNIIKSYLNK